MIPFVAKRGAVMFAASLAIVASSVASTGSAASALGNSSGHGVSLAQNTAQEAPRPTSPAAAPSVPLSWTFGSSQAASGAGWSAERGTMTPGDGGVVLQPTNDRRVVLLSPPELPAAARDAEAFVLGVSGTGLQRVRIQARRDARGGWITIADASGAMLREVADGYAITRNSSTRGMSIERLRIELTFRTTNPRPLSHISIVTTHP